MKELLKQFLIFFRIGAFTFGGGYAMIPLIQEEIVDKNEWMDNDEFLDTLAIAQSAPGAVAVNTAVFIGNKLNGFLGSMACLLGVILPSFMIILIIAMFLYQYRDNKIIDKMFLGIRPAVVALILSSVYKLAKASELKKKSFIISILALIAVAFLDINPIWTIVVGGVFGVGINLIKEEM